MSTTVGFGNPVLRNCVERLRSEAEDFASNCAQDSAKMQQSQEDLSLLSHWGKQDQKRIKSIATAAIVEADIYLTPRETSLKTQLARTKEWVTKSGAEPVLLSAIDASIEKVETAAIQCRKQREETKAILAPGQSLYDSLITGYSTTALDALVLETTVQVVDVDPKQ